MITFREPRADEIDCRVREVNKYGVNVLLYKDARVDMDILDETVGCENWQKSYQLIDGQLFCTISIWDENKHQWINKQDVGTESNIEKEKGRASDAQKRAGFALGIGRCLYTAPKIRINAKDCNIKEKDGRFACYDTFTVKQLNISNGKITGLVIRNDDMNKDVFVWGDAKTDTPVAQNIEHDEREKSISDEKIRPADWEAVKDLCRKKGVSERAVATEYGFTKPSELTFGTLCKILKRLDAMKDV